MLGGAQCAPPTLFRVNALEVLEDMFEGDCADTTAEKFLLVSNGVSCVRRSGSEDPHRH